MLKYYCGPFSFLLTGLVTTSSLSERTTYFKEVAKLKIVWLLDADPHADSRNPLTGFRTTLLILNAL